MLKWFYNLNITKKIIVFIVINSLFIVIFGIIADYYGETITGPTLVIIISALVIISILIVIIVGLALAHTISNPLNLLLQKMEEMTQGDLSIEPVEINTNDEVGKLALSFNKMVQNLRRFIKLEQSQKIREQFLKDREAFLKQIMVTSITSLDIKDTIRSIVTETGKFFKADRCYFVEFDVQTQEHSSIKDYGVYLSSLNIKDLAEAKLTQEQMKPVLKYVFGQRQVLAIDNVEEIESPKETKDLFKEFEIKSFLAAPIIYRDEIIGRIGLHYVNSCKHFTQDDIDLISAIASQSSIVIHQAKLHSQLEEAKNRESLLRSISNDILSSEDIASASEKIVAEIGKIFNVDRVDFRLFDAKNETFSEVYGEYRKNDSIPTARNKNIQDKEVDKFLIRELFDKKQTLIIDVENPNCPNLFRIGMEIFDSKTTVIIPIFYKDNLIAAFFISNISFSKFWSKEEIDFLVPIVQQVSLGIHLYQLTDKLSNSLLTERVIKDIILKARTTEDYNKIFDYLLDKLTDTFGVDRAVNLKFTPEGNLMITNEIIKNIDQKFSIGQDISNVKSTLEILPDEPDKVIVINDIDIDIKDSDLKEYFLNKRTMSLLLYPITVAHIERSQIIAIIMLCSSVPRKWTSDEINNIKLIIDATTVIYQEIKQRKDVDEQRQTFLATLTHDLRSPIIAEQKALEAILSKKLGLYLENFSEFLEDMHKTNDELLRIVNTILMTYHYESGQIELRPEPFEVKEIINDAIRSITPLAEDQGAKIIIEIQENLPSAIADKDGINRVITNLLSNAIKHNKENTNILIAAKKTDSFIQVSVSDNGKGIPDTEKSNIFHRYPTAKRKIGTGLGLYLSKQIIEANKGRIWFESEEGKGTTFYFTLPIS